MQRLSDGGLPAGDEHGLASAARSVHDVSRGIYERGSRLCRGDACVRLRACCGFLRHGEPHVQLVCVAGPGFERNHFAGQLSPGDDFAVPTRAGNQLEPRID